MKSLGSNFSESSAQRISRAIGGIEMVLESVDKDCKLSEKNTTHLVKDPFETVQQIVEDLTKENIFEFVPNRPGYKSFLINFPSNILENLDYKVAVTLALAD